MSLMTPQRIAYLAELTGGWWRTYARKWETKDRIVLYGEGRQILTRAVCAWEKARVETSARVRPLMVRSSRMTTLKLTTRVRR